MVGRSTLSHLMSYNMNPVFQKNENYDKIFVNTLLVSFIGVHRLKQYQTEEHEVNLIKGKIRFENMLLNTV